MLTYSIGRTTTQQKPTWEHVAPNVGKKVCRAVTLSDCKRLTPKTLHGCPRCKKYTMDYQLENASRQLTRAAWVNIRK